MRSLYKIFFISLYNVKYHVSLQELCEKLHEQIDLSEEERYSIEFKLNMVLNEVRLSSVKLNVKKKKTPFIIMKLTVLNTCLNEGPRPQY